MSPSFLLISISFGLVFFFLTLVVFFLLEFPLDVSRYFEGEVVQGSDGEQQDHRGDSHEDTHVPKVVLHLIQCGAGVL